MPSNSEPSRLKNGNLLHTPLLRFVSFLHEETKREERQSDKRDKAHLTVSIFEWAYRTLFDRDYP